MNSSSGAGHPSLTLTGMSSYFDERGKNATRQKYENYDADVSTLKEICKHFTNQVPYQN